MFRGGKFKEEYVVGFRNYADFALILWQHDCISVFISTAMTRITIEVPFENDLGLLLALLNRLNYPVVEKTVLPDTSPLSAENRSFILKGLPAREDMEDFIREFEMSKADRMLPGREN